MEKALEVAREHLERNPWYYPSMIHEKDCLMQMGRWEEARASVRHIMEIFPSHPHAEALRHSVGLWD